MDRVSVFKDSKEKTQKKLEHRTSNIERARIQNTEVRSQNKRLKTEG